MSNGVFLVEKNCYLPYTPTNGQDAFELKKPFWVTCHELFRAKSIHIVCTGVRLCLRGPSVVQCTARATSSPVFRPEVLVSHLSSPSRTTSKFYTELICSILSSACFFASGGWICRVPSEGDIKELSPSLADALLLARSVRNLCTRHRSELAVPLGRLGSGNERGYDNEDEAAAEANAQLWINDQLSDVRGVKGAGCSVVEDS